MQKTTNTRRKSMMLASSITLSLMLSGHTAFAGAKDDPQLLMLNIDKLETRSGDGRSKVFDSQLWLGYDLNKAVLKTEVERANGSNEKAELQLLYSQAVTPFWDFQLGVRYDSDPQPKKSWAVIGFQGLAPYNVDIDTALFVGSKGHFEYRFEAEYEQMITQRLALVPELEVNFASKRDLARGKGSGLTSSELSLNLVYEIKREFSPYIGVTWEAKHGETKRIAKQENEDASSTKFVIGLKAWF